MLKVYGIDKFSKVKCEIYNCQKVCPKNCQTKCIIDCSQNSKKKCNSKSCFVH